MNEIIFLAIMLVINVFSIFISSFLKQKGNNLATKQDIQNITKRTEDILNEYRIKMKEYENDSNFKYNYYYDQFSKLYVDLYSIICQSEYIRIFLYLTDGIMVDENEVPFLELENTRITLNTEIKFETNVSKFCKEEICNLIIDKASYANQELLKMAIAYRYVYDKYSGSNKGYSYLVTKIADDEEVHLIRAIVINIIKEYNSLRRELKMNFSESELEKGIFEKIEYKKTY